MKHRVQVFDFGRKKNSGRIYCGGMIDKTMMCEAAMGA